MEAVLRSRPCLGSPRVAKEYFLRFWVSTFTMAPRYGILHLQISYAHLKQRVLGHGIGDSADLKEATKVGSCVSGLFWQWIPQRGVEQSALGFLKSSLRWEKISGRQQALPSKATCLRITIPFLISMRACHWAFARPSARVLIGRVHNFGIFAGKSK